MDYSRYEGLRVTVEQGVARVVMQFDGTNPEIFIPKTSATVDDWALTAASQIHVDVAFMATNGVSVARCRRNGDTDCRDPDRGPGRLSCPKGWRMAAV